MSHQPGVIQRGPRFGELHGDFPGGPEVKNLPATAGDAGSIPGQGTKTQQSSDKLRPPTTTGESIQCNETAHIQGRSRVTQLRPNTAK